MQSENGAGGVLAFITSEVRRSIERALAKDDAGAWKVAGLPMEAEEHRMPVAARVWPQLVNRSAITAAWESVCAVAGGSEEYSAIFDNRSLRLRSIAASGEAVENCSWYFDPDGVRRKTMPPPLLPPPPYSVVPTTAPLIRR